MNEDQNEKEQLQTQGEERHAEAAESSASMLAAPAGGQGGGGDAARIAELERELQQERVEKGRLRQTNDELRKAQEEIARLKDENAKLSTRSATDYLSDNERDVIDKEQLAVIDKLVQGRMGDANAAVRAENERLLKEMERRDATATELRKAQFDAEVERLAPGLVAAIYDGHRDKWAKWRAERRRAASVDKSVADFDAETFAEFIKEFAEAKGIRASGDGVAARPQSSYSPRGGNRPVIGKGDTATYTVDQYSEALRSAANDYGAGRITADEYGAIKKKFNTALAEGRIVQQ